jgi:hypothetical protein
MPKSTSLTYNGIIPMKSRSIPSFLALSGVLLGAAGLQGQITLVGFGFTDAPTSVGTEPANTTSAATTLAAGLGSGTFTVVRNNTTAENQSGIANVVGSSGVGAAQISGRQSNTYGWEVGSVDNFFEFTLTFGGVPASAISFDELVLVGRTAVEWDNAGGLNGYNSGRGSSITLRSSLDGYAANIGGEINPAFTNTNNDWVTTTIDLSGLVLAGTEESVTFRLYTRSNTPTASGNSLFHRTQLDSVELTGVIPEPSTYAALFGLFALGFVIWRRRTR